MTEKSFFEVFPSLELGESLQGLFGQVKVTKVAMTRAKDLLRVYISSEKLISKKHIYEAEKQLKPRSFPLRRYGCRFWKNLCCPGSTLRKNSWMCTGTAFWMS